MFDLPSSEENIRGREERKMGGGHANSVWSHSTTVYRATNFTPFWLMYAMLPEEIKH
jgi:hypothetical protein